MKIVKREDLDAFGQVAEGSQQDQVIKLLLGKLEDYNLSDDFFEGAFYAMIYLMSACLSAPEYKTEILIQNVGILFAQILRDKIENPDQENEFPEFLEMPGIH